MTSLRIAGGAAVTILVLALGSGSGAALPAAPPNILLVMTDDQGFGDLSLHGNPVLQTPHLDQFGREGVRLANFHVSPFCAPTRASLLTGRYALRTGVTGVTANQEVMRAAEVTLAEALRSAGYVSACIGKWHNGEQFPHNAVGQGFDEFFGFNGGHFNNYFDATLRRGTAPVRTTGYITDVLTDEAIAFMRRHQDRPFFCYLPLNAPHTPCQVADTYFDAFKARGLDDYNASIYGMCRNIDDNFGRLLAALDELRLRENTIVLFLTDNGANGERFNAGMRGWKTSVHEGGTRVPLFVQWPRASWQPRVVSQLAAHLDLYPTLLELLEVERPRGSALDGISLAPWLRGERDDRLDRRIFVYSSQAVPARPFPGGVRTDRWRLLCEAGRATIDNPRWQLYDLQADPGEATDLAGKRPEVVRELGAAYRQWWSGVQSGWEPLHRIEVGHDAENPVTLNAPQVTGRDGLKFAVRMRGTRPNNPGFAHDWLADWRGTDARAEWMIDVVAAGDYEVVLLCNVKTADAGARIRVTAAGALTEGLTRANPGQPVDLPHRDERSAGRYLNRTWAEQSLGTLRLPAGSTTLRVQAVTMPGTSVMELKAVRLRRR